MAKKLFGQEVLERIHMETVVDMRTGLIKEIRWVREDGHVYTDKEYDALVEYIMGIREQDLEEEEADA